MQKAREVGRGKQQVTGLLEKVPPILWHPAHLSANFSNLFRDLTQQVLGSLPVEACLRRSHSQFVAFRERMQAARDTVQQRLTIHAIATPA
jgi:hypothetical protein